MAPISGSLHDLGTKSLIHSLGTVCAKTKWTKNNWNHPLIRGIYFCGANFTLETTLLFAWLFAVAFAFSPMTLSVLFAYSIYVYLSHCFDMKLTEAPHSAHDLYYSILISICLFSLSSFAHFVFALYTHTQYIGPYTRDFILYGWRNGASDEISLWTQQKEHIELCDTIGEFAFITIHGRGT